MRNKSKQTNNWIKIRKFLNDLHLWGGLISGIIVFLVCLSGTIYVYNSEIRAWAQAEFYKVKPTGDKLPVDSLLANIKAEVPGKIVGVKIPFAADATTQVLYMKKEASSSNSDKPASAQKVEPKPAKNPDSTSTAKPKEDQKDLAKKGAESEKKVAPAGGGRGPRTNQFAVNPYSGAAIGDPSAQESSTVNFMGKLFSIHRWLLLDKVEKPIIEGVENRKLGSWITGSATLLFLFGVLSGIVIWFPNKLRSWKNGLNIRWTANWKRINHDLHNTLGFYSFILLFLMSVTGPFWSFDWYRTGWQKTWGTYKSPDAPKVEKAALVSIVPSDSSAAMSVEETILAVNKVLPYDGDISINFAKDSTGTISVSKNRVGFFAPSAGDKLQLDQYSGTVLEKDIFREKPFNERASASIKALHIGDIYGQFSKFLYFIACLIATSLPVTGVMIWLNKKKKKRKPEISK